jgi:hypothetical protein
MTTTTRFLRPFITRRAGRVRAGEASLAATSLCSVAGLGPFLVTG